MRTVLTLLSALALSAGVLHAQHHLTPYEYGHGAALSVQGGPLFFYGEYSNLLGDYGQAGKMFAPFGEVSFSYFFNDAISLRTSASYGLRKTGVLEPSAGFYPYQFDVVQLFADYVVNFYTLGEYYIAFNPLLYVGLGAAGSFGFSDPGHPYLTLHPRNLVPGFRLGGILEYDFRNGTGVFTDLGLEWFTDRYNGQDPDSFPIDMNIRLGFGVIWHFGYR